MEKREVFVWKKMHEKALLAEVCNVEPYKWKVGSKERGKAWTEVSDNLNSLEGFKTIQRSVREKFEKMLKNHDRKENEEKKASGVEVEYSEIDQDLEDIKGRIAEVEEEQEKEKAKAKKEKATAEKMRSKAMETLGETRKKQSSKNVDTEEGDDEAVAVTPKRKRSQASMTEILNEAMSAKKQANEIRQKELELQSEDTKQQHMFLQNILVQQHQFQQQQNAMNQAFLNTLANIMNKN